MPEFRLSEEALAVFYAIRRGEYEPRVDDLPEALTNVDLDKVLEELTGCGFLTERKSWRKVRYSQNYKVGDIIYFSSPPYGNGRSIVDTGTLEPRYKKKLVKIATPEEVQRFTEYGYGKKPIEDAVRDLTAEGFIVDPFKQMLLHYNDNRAYFTILCTDHKFVRGEAMRSEDQANGELIRYVSGFALDKRKNKGIILTPIQDFLRVENCLYSEGYLVDKVQKN